MSGITTMAWELWDVKGVIFDKDGTITDVNVYWGKIIELRARALCKQFTLDAQWEEKLRTVLGWDNLTNTLLPNGPIAILPRNQVIEITYRFLLGNGVEGKGLREGIIAAFDKALATFNEMQNCYTILLPGVKDFMDQLKAKGIPMALITSDATSSAVTAMEYLGLTTYFTRIAGREPGKEANKEDGILCKEVLETMGVNPANAVAIGDTPTDCKMAKNAGLMASIGVFTGQVPKKVLEEHTPYTVSSMRWLKVVL